MWQFFFFGPFSKVISKLVAVVKETTKWFLGSYGVACLIAQPLRTYTTEKRKL